MILVDTPIWSLSLRRKAAELNPAERHLTQLLNELLHEGRVELLGPVRQELLAGLREESQFRRLRDYLRDFPDTQVSIEDHEEAARLSNHCRRSGITASPIDMLVCAVAIHHGWEIFSTDRDFVHYKSVLNIRLLS